MDDVLRERGYDAAAITAVCANGTVA